MKAFMNSMGINSVLAESLVGAKKAQEDERPEVQPRCANYTTGLPEVGTVCLVKSIHRFSPVNGQPIACRVTKDVYWDVRFEPPRPVMMMEILTGPHKGHWGQVTINKNVIWMK